MQQPIGAGVQKQTELVGLPALAGLAARLRVELVIIDHVLHPVSGAIDFLVKHLGPTGQIGNDEADVGAPRCRLDAGRDPAFS